MQRQKLFGQTIGELNYCINLARQQTSTHSNKCLLESGGGWRMAGGINHFLSLCISFLLLLKFRLLVHSQAEANKTIFVLAVDRRKPEDNLKK